ncbi:hypothetical protein CAPTEDRAFT_208401 [Capitella teleta]|uniref:Uncharacterized protein n=1 Tax=Capitella teleta TaxID=283909 RepID=R7T657_CAPTE|nr:hypothetical protein CAPTEDRAFT_208401 [Capitella teleta]|eukprot:ELT88880.1 hypothetical protein CAPTEDRAFT_208401 [Capitella teleta]
MAPNSQGFKIEKKGSASRGPDPARQGSGKNPFGEYPPSPEVAGYSMDTVILVGFFHENSERSVCFLNYNSDEVLCERAHPQVKRPLAHHVALTVPTRSPFPERKPLSPIQEKSEPSCDSDVFCFGLKARPESPDPLDNPRWRRRFQCFPLPPRTLPTLVQGKSPSKAEQATTKAIERSPPEVPELPAKQTAVMMRQRPRARVCLKPQYLPRRGNPEYFEDLFEGKAEKNKNRHF